MLIIAACAVILFTLKDTLNPIINEAELLKVDIDNFDGKLDMLSNIGFYIGTLVFVCSTGIMSTRVVTAKVIKSDHDPKLIIMLNRIIRNTIEQFYVFAFLYTFILLKNGAKTA